MRSSRTTLRSLALLLALTGVLFRGLIPAGFMPAVGTEAQSGAILVLCSGGTLKSAATAADPSGTPVAQAMDECPFAAATSPGLLASPAPLSTLHEAASSEPAALRAIGPVAAASHIRPPTRAPPVIT